LNVPKFDSLCYSSSGNAEYSSVLCVALDTSVLCIAQWWMAKAIRKHLLCRTVLADP